MEKARNRLKSILLAVAAVFVFGLTFLLAGCQSAFFRGVQERGYAINRLIYTDNTAKYLQGKTLLSGKIEWESSSSTTTTLDFDKYKAAGIYAYVSSNNTVDIVMSTVAPEENAGDYTPIINPMMEFVFLCSLPTMAGDPFVVINGDTANGFYPMVPFNAQRLFIYGDPHYDMLNINYTISKEDGSECTCGTYTEVDTARTNCGCYGDQIYEEVYNAEGKCVTNMYYPNINLATVPNCCYVVTEIFETDEETGESVSTNTFKIEERCTGRLKIEFDAPTVENFAGEMAENNNGHIAFPDFEELIIDGFNLDNYKVWFMQLLGPALNSTYFDQMGIAEYLDFNDFSYMFHNLPCRKVRLNNITGFGSEFAIRDLSHMFANCKNLVSVDFGNFFEGHQPEDMSYMFFNCPNLADVDLTTLDTSKVEDMSYMFCANPPRDVLVADVINSQLIPYANAQAGEEAFPVTNNGQLWTWDSAAMYMIDLDDELKQEYAENPQQTLQKQKLEIAQICAELGFLTKMGLTYDEFAMVMSNYQCFTFAEFVDFVNEDPSLIGLTAKEDGTPYTENEIKLTLKEMFADENAIMVGTANEVSDFYAGKPVVYDEYQEVEIERETYMQQIISANVIPQIVANGDAAVLPNATTMTWEEYALYFIEENADWKAKYDANPAETLAQAKIEVVFVLLNEGTLKEIALSYDEMVAYITQYKYLTVAEIVVAINEDPTQLGLSAKEDGTPYTAEEVEEYTRLTAGHICALQKVNIILGTAEEVEVMKRQLLAEIVVDERKVVLGGEGSKFVIKEGMNTNNMLTSKFDTLVAPIIEEGVTVELGGQYEMEDGTKLSTLTSVVSNQSMSWYEEPPIVVDPDFPEDGKKMSTVLLVALIALATAVMATGITAVVLSQQTTKKKKFSIFEFIMRILKRDL
ncbi:MAG: BspA family leucine-rich repeat surface protein [Clostridia bacterium]|nr:BspA family leucine-rich repeat surface protein [Clostridia bacterium]